jgi:hypothetical protein
MMKFTDFKRNLIQICFWILRIAWIGIQTRANDPDQRPMPPTGNCPVLPSNHIFNTPIDTLSVARFVLRFRHIVFQKIHYLKTSLLSFLWGHIVALLDRNHFIFYYRISV